MRITIIATGFENNKAPKSASSLKATKEAAAAEQRAAEEEAKRIREDVAVDDDVIEPVLKTNETEDVLSMLQRSRRSSNPFGRKF